MDRAGRVGQQREVVDSRLRRPPLAWIASQTSTLSPISTKLVIRGSSTRFPPYGVRAWRVVLAPSRTQSGHWNPTEADRMQSGQIGRSQRWQRIHVSRSGCR